MDIEIECPNHSSVPRVRAVATAVRTTLPIYRHTAVCWLYSYRMRKSATTYTVHGRARGPHVRGHVVAMNIRGRSRNAIANDRVTIGTLSSRFTLQLTTVDRLLWRVVRGAWWTSTLWSCMVVLFPRVPALNMRCTTIYVRPIQHGSRIGHYSTVRFARAPRGCLLSVSVAKNLFENLCSAHVSHWCVCMLAHLVSSTRAPVHYW